MSRTIRTEEEADRELEEAFQWYEERHSGLGRDFLAEVDQALKRISRFPETGSPVPRVPGDLRVRRVSLKKFPYHIVYVETPEAIRILACAHKRRRPGYWHERALNP